MKQDAQPLTVASCALAVLLAGSIAGTAETELPPLGIPGVGAIVKAEQIFDIRSKPTRECHASSIVETNSGLVATWFGGTREKDPDVGIWISRQIDGEWTAPQEVVNGVQSRTVRYACWNPVLFQAKQGPLMLFYKVGPSPTSWWGMVTRSDDDGETWSWPTKLGEHWAIGHLLGPVKNKPVQLADGSILCPSSTEIDVETGDGYWRVHFEVTQDHGKTWNVIGPINNGIKFDVIQPSLLSYPNGDLQVLCRSKQEVVAQSWSKDGGKSWSEFEATNLPNPSSGTDAVSLSDGRQLLVYNHTTRRTKIPSRQMLNVAISDSGHDWKPAVTLELETGTRPSGKRHWGEYSYPAVIQTKDGNIHITYTYNREGVKHVVMDPNKL